MVDKGMGQQTVQDLLSGIHSRYIKIADNFTPIVERLACTFPL